MIAHERRIENAARPARCNLTLQTTSSATSPRKTRHGVERGLHRDDHAKCHAGRSRARYTWPSRLLLATPALLVHPSLVILIRTPRSHFVWAAKSSAARPSPARRRGRTAPAAYPAPPVPGFAVSFDVSRLQLDREQNMPTAPVRPARRAPSRRPVSSSALSDPRSPGSGLSGARRTQHPACHPPISQGTNATRITGDPGDQSRHEGVGVGRLDLGQCPR
jgi:hypothetical protein